MGEDLASVKWMLLSLLLGFSMGIMSLFVLAFQIFQRMVFSI